jgi:alkanesulfonate monooxygenase SsuD/methylene tetrahydromethanopterin reductase-like flavin-dependent oxidoreductase (luciferase family)
MIDEVKLAETLGFDGAWFAEHRVAGFAFGSPALFIAACARETQRIRLGCSVSLLPLNNPVRTAEDYAMADVLSHGRCTDTTTISPTFRWVRAGSGSTRTWQSSVRYGRRIG